METSSKHQLVLTDNSHLCRTDKSSSILVHGKLNHQTISPTLDIGIRLLAVVLKVNTIYSHCILKKHQLGHVYRRFSLNA